MERRFIIDLGIYSIENLKQAISDFSDVATISLEWDNLLIIWETEEEVREVFNEFMNYVISLID